MLNGHVKIDLVNGVNFSQSLTVNFIRENNMRLTRELAEPSSN